MIGLTRGVYTQSWLRDVNQTCIGVKLSEAPNGDALSPAVRGMLDVLARMEKWLEEIPVCCSCLSKKNC